MRSWHPTLYALINGIEPAREIEDTKHPKVKR